MAAWQTFADSEIGQALVAAGAAVFGYTKIRKYFKLDTLDNSKIAAESDILAMLRGEITRMAVQIAANVLAITELQARNQVLEDKNELLELEIYTLRKELRSKNGT